MPIPGVSSSRELATSGRERHLGEPLACSGRSRLVGEMQRVKAKIASNSRAIGTISNAEAVNFELEMRVHEQLRGSLVRVCIQPASQHAQGLRNAHRVSKIFSEICQP